MTLDEVLLRLDDIHEEWGKSQTSLYTMKEVLYKLNTLKHLALSTFDLSSEMVSAVSGVDEATLEFSYLLRNAEEAEEAWYVSDFYLY